jgi:hypothetical protein
MTAVYRFILRQILESLAHTVFALSCRRYPLIAGFWLPRLNSRMGARCPFLTTGHIAAMDQLQQRRRRDLTRGVRDWESCCHRSCRRMGAQWTPTAHWAYATLAEPVFPFIDHSSGLPWVVPAEPGTGSRDECCRRSAARRAVMPTITLPGCERRGRRDRPFQSTVPERRDHDGDDTQHQIGRDQLWDAVYAGDGRAGARQGKIRLLCAPCVGLI